MLCESFYYRKKRETSWSESIAAAAATELLQKDFGVTTDVFVDQTAITTSNIPMPSPLGGPSIEPTPASQAGSVFSFPESALPPRHPQSSAPDPMAPMVMSSRNLLQPCVAVAQDPTGYCSKLFHLDDKLLMWPVVEHGNVCIQEVKLSNIDAGLSTCCIYAIGTSADYLIFVGCKPTDSEGSQKCHIFVYRFSNGTLGFVQDLRVAYKPLEMKKMKINEHSYIFVLGSDRDLHVYAVDKTSGRLLRTSDSEQTKMEWRAHLGLSTSLGLRLLAESWGNGGQAMVGFADGYLFWHRVAKFGTTSTAPESTEPTADPFLPNYAFDFTTALLLDSAVTCIAFYKKNFSSEHRKRALLERIGMVGDVQLAPLCIVGLANGSTVVLSPAISQADNAVLSGLDRPEHGPVTCICVGNVLGQPYDNVVVGHHDGSLFVYSLHPELFNFTETQHDSYSVNPSGYPSPRSYSSHTDTWVNADVPNQMHDFQSALVEEYRTKLPFPVISVEFGSLVSPNSFAEDNNVHPIVSGRQLVAVTTDGFHIFTLRDPGMFKDIEVDPNNTVSSAASSNVAPVVNAVVRELCEILDMVVD